MDVTRRKNLMLEYVYRRSEIKSENDTSPKKRVIKVNPMTELIPKEHYNSYADLSLSAVIFLRASSIWLLSFLSF